MAGNLKTNVQLRMKGSWTAVWGKDKEGVVRHSHQCIDLRRRMSSPTSCSQQKEVAAMDNFTTVLSSSTAPGCPAVLYDTPKRRLLHSYQAVQLDPQYFQAEVELFLARQESFSSNVVTVVRIRDERIVVTNGLAKMQVSVVTEYVPFRLHQATAPLTVQQALFLMEGALRGFRELLHRVRSPFPVHEWMIGVDGEGKVRVWWNETFSSNHFGFPPTGQVRLRDMVRSLVQAVTKRTDPEHASRLESSLLVGEATFVSLEERVKLNADKLNLALFGQTLLQTVQEVATVRQQTQGYENLKVSNVRRGLRLSGVQYHSPQERIILSPRKNELTGERKVIVKRVYQDGTSPAHDDKLRIIKQDIESLRDIVQPEPSLPVDRALSPVTKLRSSRSVGTLYSYQSPLCGDTRIPQVSRVIKESQVVGSQPQLEVSRFIEPAAASEGCGVCSQLQGLRQSQVREVDHREGQPLFLSRVQLVTADKSVNSTSRSMSESRLEKSLAGLSPRARFGESEKKLPAPDYFTTLFQQ